MTPDPRRRRVIVGVDTHKYIHVAVALDVIGGVIDSQSFAADSGGYEQLITWALGLGPHLTFAIEGTGSYGAGLTSAVRRRGVGAVEVMRTDRRDRRGCEASPTPWMRRTLPALSSRATPLRSRRRTTARWR